MLSPAWEKRLRATGYTPEDFALEAPAPVDPEEQKQLELKRHYLLATFYLQNGKHTQALEEFQAALHDSPENPNILLGMADAYMAMHNFLEAEKTIEQVLRADPKNVRALISKATLLMARAETGRANQKGDLLRQAVAAYQKAKELQPRNMDVLKGLASAYMALQDIDKIIQAYRDIVRVDPKDIHSTLILASVLADTGRIQEAITLYERVIEERRGFLTTYLFLGKLYEDTRQLDKAIETYKRALVVDPRNERLRVRFEGALLRKYGEQNPGAVLNEYKKFAAAYPHSSGLQRLYADRLLTERNYPQAIEQFKKVVELDPNNIDSLMALSQLLLQIRNYDEARQYLERAVDVDPSRIDAYHSLADSYTAQNQPEKAVEVYRKALRMNPESEKLMIGLADVLSRAGDAQAAIKTLLETTTATATRPEFQAVLGQAYERARDYAQALRHYQAAFEKSPTSLAIIAKLLAMNLRTGQVQQAEEILGKVVQSGSMPKDDLYALAGEAFLAEGYPEKAADAYEKAFQANPDSLKLLVRLIEINNLRDEHEANFRILDRVTGSLAGTDELLELRAQTLLDQKKYEEALEIYRKLQREHPSNEDWVRTLVDALIQTQRYDEALNLVRKNTDLLGREGAQVLRGVILYKAKRYSQAEKVFKDLLKSPGSSLAMAANYYYYLGSIYLDQQRYDQAEKAFRDAVRADPTNDSALNALGYMLADRNQKLTEARDLIEKAYNRNPSAPHILDSMGWIHFRLGNYEEALDYVLRSHRLMGDDPEILDHLGDIYMKLGQVEKAQEAYRRALSLDPARPGLKSKIIGSGN